MTTSGRSQSEVIAQRFHETYERLAPSFGYETRPESAMAWENVPQANRSLMMTVVYCLLREGVITATDDASHFSSAHAVTSLCLANGGVCRLPFGHDGAHADDARSTP